MKKPQLVSKYWPGTNIVKSKNNAFDWQTNKEALTNSRDWRQSIAGTIGASMKKQSMTVYSKAKPAK